MFYQKYIGNVWHDDIDDFNNLASIATFVGGPLATFLTGMFVDAFQEKSMMTIPMICIIKSLMEVPFMWMIFGQQKTFYLAVGGLYCEYFLAKGWTSSAMLILTRVVDPEISYLGINTFIMLGSLNNAITPNILTAIIGDLHFEDNSGEIGDILFYMCVVALVTCCPFFYLAGKALVKKQNQAIKEGKTRRATLNQKNTRNIYTIIGAENLYDGFNEMFTEDWMDIDYQPIQKKKTLEPEKQALTNN